MARLNALSPSVEGGGVGLIQGILPDSHEEWRTAVALWTYKWDFRFQVPVRGGRGRRGGIIIDFLVGTKPLATPLFVDGEYWHKGTTSERDVFRRALIRAFMDGRARDPIVLPGSELYDQDAANRAILKTLGRN